jgi:hypothetical protein
MGSSLPQPSLPTPLLLSEKPRKQAKATLKDVRKAENTVLWTKWGAAIEDVQCLFRLTLKEFAAELQKDERQVQRWIEAKERPQIETVMSVARFEPPLLIALAQRTSGVSVDTVIHVRRSA